ncbi:Ylh47p, partial [Cyberlindnera jadinii NRRL Y-1542]
SETKEIKDVPQTVEKKEKPPLWDRIKHEVHHYWDGTKLLGYEVNISTKLLFKMLRGYELTRREQTQLSRTTGDLFRLVPFSAFIIIPFAELLLPIALKLFPNLLPSTYESKDDKKKKKAQLIKTRDQTSSFLRQTFKESGIKIPKSTSEQDKAEFVQFFRSLNTLGESPSKEQVIKIARLFKNDLVLDNLSRPQLVAMAKYMNLRPFGSDQILRYQIRYRLLQIIKDDRAIDYEGVSSLSVKELQSACSSRGIKTQGVSPARLKDDLNIWLDLRLRQKIPSTLLILSSVYTYGEASNLDSYYDALVQVLRSIPDQVYNITKSEVS